MKGSFEQGDRENSTGQKPIGELLGCFQRLLDEIDRTRAELACQLGVSRASPGSHFVAADPGASPGAYLPKSLECQYRTAGIGLMDQCGSLKYGIRTAG